MYCKQLLLLILLLLHLPLQYWMFVCATSIIYKAAFILISTGTSTEESHDIFSIFFFFTDTDVLQDSKEKQGTILYRSLYHFHELSDIYLQFCIIFNTYKQLCVSGKQKYTMAVWHNVYITKKLLSALTEARRGVPGKHYLPNPCFFSFLIFSLKSNPSRNIVVRCSILI